MSKIEQRENYPVALVIIAYGFWGGFVAGVIFALYFVATVFFEGVSSSLGSTIVPLIIFTVVLGFIPAIFAGIWLACIKFTVTKKIDYFKVAVIGFFSTVFYLVTYSSITNHTNYPILGIGLVGALSAMILGWIVLPKAKETE